MALVLDGTSGVSGTSGTPVVGAGSIGTTELAATAVTAGTYVASTTTVDSKGRLTSVSTPTGTANTTTYLRGDNSWATVGGSTTAGAVGTYAFGMVTSGTVSPGGTVAGSTLRGRNVSAGDGSYNPSFSGTWQCMGAGQGGDNTNQFNSALWLRIS